MTTWAHHPGMHVYHYASYEPTVLKRLSQRYGTRIDEVDALLRGERLVDLYAVVRQGLRIGVESYSIKSLEQLYNPAARAGAQVEDAGSSIVEYERWRQQSEQSVLDAIGAYNRDDCQHPPPSRVARGSPPRGAGRRTRRAPARRFHSAPAEHFREPDPEFVAVEAALTVGVPDDPAERASEQHTRALLASLLQWHSRENRAEWWEYLRVRKLGLDELEGEPATLGGLGTPVLIGQEKRSGIWRYRMPPQECRIRLGDRVDHAGQAGGTSLLVGLDLEQGWVELKRSLAKASPHPVGLLPSSPVDASGPVAALLRVGCWAADHGLDAAGPYGGVRDLLPRPAAAAAGRRHASPRRRGWRRRAVPGGTAPARRPPRPGAPVRARPPPGRTRFSRSSGPAGRSASARSAIASSLTCSTR